MFNLNSKQRYSLGIALLSVPALFFFVNVAIFAVNLPYRDDYACILLFLNNWTDAPGLLAKFNLIVQPMFDHYIVLVKLVSLAVWKVFGSADMKVIILIGAAGLFVGAFALYHCFRRDVDDGMKPLLFLPAALLFFTPIYSENLYQAMASVSIFYPVTLGISALVLLDNKRERSVAWFILAAVIAVMAFYAHREGMVFLITGGMLLLYRKKWARAGVWAAVTVASYLFFRFYGNGTGGAGGFNLDPANFGRYAFYFFSFIGNVFGINTMSDYYLQGSAAFRFLATAMPIAAGLFVCIAFAILTIRKYYKKNPLVYAILLSAFIIAVGAAFQRSDAQPVVSRYRIVTILFYVCLYLAFLEAFGEGKRLKVFLLSSVGASLLFNVTVTVMKYQPILKHRNELINSFAQWKKTGDGLIPIAWTPSDPRPILNESIRKGVYRLPPEFDPALK